MRDSGATLTTDRNGVPNQAYWFNGIDNMIYRDTIFPVAGDVTYACWMLPDTSLDASVLYNGNSNANGFGLIYTNSAGVLGTKVEELAGNVCACVGSPAAIHQWHHIALRLKSGTFTLFVDSVNVGSSTHSYYSPCCKFSLGLDYTNGTNPFKGKIDDVAIYNRALSDSEVREIYMSYIAKDSIKPICIGASVTLHASNAATYFWTPSSGLSCTTCTDPVASPTSTTSYYVTKSYSYDCNVTDTFLVKVNPLPRINAGSDKIICRGGTVNIIATGGKTYNWTPATGLSCSSCVNPIGSPTVSTRYVVTGTDTNGCRNTDTLLVTVNSLPIVNAGPDKAYCKGSSTNLTVSGASTYSWSPATSLSCTSCTSPIASPSSSTIYIVTGTDTNGCKASDTIKVIVNPLPIVNAGPDKTVCGSNRVILNASGALDYSWSPAGGLSCTACASPSSLPIVNTTYIVTGTDANGCINTDTVLVKVFPSPVIRTGPDETICKYTSVKLTVSGGKTYLWSPATGLSCTTCNTTNASPSLSTTYIVIGTDTNGCMNNDTIIVNVLPQPNISAGSDKNICIGNSVKLYGSGGISYTWLPTATLSCAVCDSTVAKPASFTIYKVIGKDINGCADTSQVSVFVNPPPTISVIPPNLKLCSGSGDTLTASGAVSYIWHPNTSLSCTTCSNTFTTTTANTIYTVVGTDANGCTDSAKSVITIINKSPVSFSPDQIICKGQHVQLNANGGNSYTWIPGTYLNNDNIANPIANPDTGMTYKVIINQNNCFTDTGIINIIVNPVPDINAGPDQTIGSGTNAQLYANASMVTSFSWTPSITLNCATCQNPVASPEKTTTYTVTVTGTDGCIASDEVTIYVTCENLVFVPNTFTPNADGLNDRFYPSGKGITNIKRFSIYDRWGERIYNIENISLNDPSVGWDGRYNNKQLAPDVFVYLIEATCASGEPLLIKGSVALVR